MGREDVVDAQYREGRGEGRDVRQQCTAEYKVEVVNKAIRRELFELKHRQRIPKDVLIYQYFGGAPLYWTNTGTLRKSGGSGTTSINSFNFFNQPGGVIETFTDVAANRFIAVTEGEGTLK